MQKKICRRDFLRKTLKIGLAATGGALAAALPRTGLQASPEEAVGLAVVSGNEKE